MRKLPTKATKVQTGAQFRALSSPTRHAIEHVILINETASVREIAVQLGRHPASLYKHIDRLLEVGLIEEVGTTATTRRDARVFRCTAWGLAYEPGNVELTDGLVGFIESELRHAGRSLAASLHMEETSEPPLTVGPHRETHFGTLFGWLTPDELAGVNEHLEAIYQIMMRTPRRPGTRLVSFVSALFPRPKGRRAATLPGEHG